MADNARLDFSKLLGFKLLHKSAQDDLATVVGATFNKNGAEVPPGSRPDAIGTLFNKIGEVTGPNTAALGMLFNKAGEGVQDPFDS
jgi:hypothetical protein